MATYTTNYKTFKNLMADIEDDLSSVAGENYIYSDKYLKIAETCNSKLSTKINPLKEDLITVTNGRGKFPNDFKVLESIFLCVETQIAQPVINMTQELLSARYCLNDINNSCGQISYVEDCKGVLSFLVCKKETDVIVNIKKILPVTIVDSEGVCAGTCPIYSTSKVQIRIVKEDDSYYIQTNIDGDFFIVYTANMIDDEGNLLVLDHPLVNPYYEYAIKDRIFEDLWLNSLAETQQKLGYIKEELRKAQIEAIRFVRMFDFAELKKIFFDNRKRMRLKYHNIIQE